MFHWGVTIWILTRGHLFSFRSSGFGFGALPGQREAGGFQPRRLSAAHRRGRARRAPEDLERGPADGRPR